MTRRFAAVVLAAALAAAPTSVSGAGPGSGSVSGSGSGSGSNLGSFLDRALARLRAAADARALHPPRPVTPRFRLVRLFDADLGARPLALAAGSLDGDRTAELVLLTAGEVVVLRVTGDAARLVARHPLAGPPPVPRPRAPVGALEIGDRDGDGVREVVARTSLQSDGVRLALEGGALVERARLAGFPLCGARAELVPGRTGFAGDRVAWDGAAPAGLPALPLEFAVAGCVDGLVDREGRPLRAGFAVDLDGRLAVACAGAGGPCGAPTDVPRAGVGTAVALGDLDGDGVPELAHAGAGAPGQPDAVEIIGRRRALHHRDFAGGVVGLAVADVDGDGAAEVIAAERGDGPTHVTLWRLN